MPKQEKKSKSNTSSRTGHVQFRPPRMLQDQLAGLARAWDVSENEAAKELCLLSCVGLGARHRKLVRSLASALGDDQDLNRACEWFFVSMMERIPSWDTHYLLRDPDDEPASVIADLIREVKKREVRVKGT